MPTPVSRRRRMDRLGSGGLMVAKDTMPKWTRDGTLGRVRALTCRNTVGPVGLEPTTYGLKGRHTAVQGMWHLRRSVQTTVLDATKGGRGDAVVAKWWPRATPSWNSSPGAGQVHPPTVPVRARLATEPLTRHAAGWTGRRG